MRVPGPVPHPGFQKQQFARNVGLFWGRPGPAFPAPPRRIEGSRGSRAGIKNIFFQLLPEGSHVNLCLGGPLAATKVLRQRRREADDAMQGRAQVVHDIALGLPGARRFGAMEVTKPYEFIGFGAMDVTKPYEFIGFGAMDVTADYLQPRFPRSPGAGQGRRIGCLSYLFFDF